jgi:L-aspartate oxidase
MDSYPLVVVGGGLAGLLVARLAAESSPVIVLTKSDFYSSNTQHSQGGIAAVWSNQDSVALHTKDTIIAGHGLCDDSAVEVLSEYSRAAVQTLIDLGTKFDKGDDDQYLLGLEGAHSIKRILHAGGDSTGAEIQRALVDSVLSHPNIQAFEHCQVTKILVEDEQVSGVLYINRETEESHQIDCKQLLFATGGAGMLFQHTSNNDVATGDGLAVLYDAGAELMDLEFFQFHPTGLSLLNAPTFLITEALRGEGAILRNYEGVAFMEKVHPQKDLAPRDIVSRGIAYECQRTGKDIYLDATHLSSEMLPKRFPKIFRTCLEYGIDIRTDQIPISPVAHYMMGGVSTDLWGRTTVAGLYACGEVARTGVHGANRLASNSLLEAAVFAIRTEIAIHDDQKNKKIIAKPKSEKISPSIVLPSKKDASKLTVDELRALLWDHVSLIRKEETLELVLQNLQDAKFPDPHLAQPEFELECMKLLGKLVAESALERKESRGAHFREDYPQIDKQSPKVIVKRKSDN